jgi:hypothetical protein
MTGQIIKPRHVRARRWILFLTAASLIALLVLGATAVALS